MEGVPDEATPSLERGFTTLWPVYADYEISGTGVAPRGTPVHLYAPIIHRELPQEVAKLHLGDTARVQHFARAYGLLGQSHLLDQASGLDDLGWIWAHAETVRVCLAMTHVIQERDAPALREMLQSWQVVEPAAPDLTATLWPALVVAFREQIMLQRWAWGEPTINTGSDRRLPIAQLPEVMVDVAAHEQALQQDTNLLLFARTIRRDIINANIALIHRSLMEVEEEPRDRSYFRFRALIEVVYWLLADLVDTGQVALCEACRAFFIQTRAGQRFCPPRVGQKESACAIRQRVRKHLHKR